VSSRGLRRRLRASVQTLVFLFVFSFSLAAGPARTQEAEAEKTSALDRVFLEYSAGLDYSRGDYGLDRNSSLIYLPLGVTADYDYWRFSVLVPVLYANGVTGAQSFGGPPPPGSDTIVSDHNAGLGEVVTSGSYLFAPPGEGLPWVELTGQILWPTRTNENLGTGDFGFTTQLDLFQQFGRITPFARVGRNFYLVGSLRDRFYTSIGASVEIAEGTSGGIAYDWLGSTSPDLEDGHELVPYLSFKASEHWTFGPYGVIGLAQGSPDFGVGLSIRFRP